MNDIEMTLKIVVKPYAGKTQITGKTDKGELKLDVAAPPKEGKANIEVIKFFRKRYKLQAEIISGKTSRKKKVRLFSV